MARRDEQPRAGGAGVAGQELEGFEEDALFGRVRARGDDERSVCAEAEAASQLARERQLARLLKVELDAARDAHALGGEPERAQARGVLPGLHRGEREVGEDAADEEAYEAVAAERLLRDATVDERHGDAAPPALAEEARPQLRLHHQHRRRIDTGERAAHAPSPVEREVEDERRRVGEGLARDALPRQRRRRDDERAARILLGEGAGEGSRRLRLSDRDAVKPDDGPPPGVELRQQPGALAEARRVLPVPQRVEQKPRQQRRDADAEEDAVEKIHQ